MRLLPPDREAYLYVISCQQGLTKIGVAADANERLRKMRVDSPLPLELVYAFYHPRAEDAYAVLEDLKRQLSAQQEHGRWYEATAAEVRLAFGNRSACQAARAAAEARLAASAAELAAEQQRKARLGERRRSRAQQRRQKLRAAAELFAAGKTQAQVALELGKNVRTIRRWQKLAGFEAELAKAKLRHERAAEREERRVERQRERKARRQLARSDPHRYAIRYGVASSRWSPRPGEQPLPLRGAGGRVKRVVQW